MAYDEICHLITFKNVSSPENITLLLGAPERPM
jgi:hypothetical protein